MPVGPVQAGISLALAEAVGRGATHAVDTTDSHPGAGLLDLQVQFSPLQKFITGGLLLS
jgi:hypothetical protein